MSDPDTLWTLEITWPDDEEEDDGDDRQTVVSDISICKPDGSTSHDGRGSNVRITYDRIKR